MLSRGILFITVLAMTWLGCMDTAFARKKQPKQLELQTYSATEDEDAPPSTPPVPLKITKVTPVEPAPRRRAPSRPVKPKAAAAPIKLVFHDRSSEVPSPPVAALKTTARRTGFDPVASDQIENIAERLKLVEILVRKHARAYDYRIYSARELQNILAELDRNAAGTAAPTRRGRDELPETLPPPSEPEVDTSALPDPDMPTSDGM